MTQEERHERELWLQEKRHERDLSRLVDVLWLIALADQIPGHVNFRTKSEMARLARQAVIGATGVDPHS